MTINGGEMNYCRKCQSDYSVPGTCNCFAPQKAAPYVPFYPYRYCPWYPAPYHPDWTYRPYIGTPIAPTITWGGTTGNIVIGGNTTTTDGKAFGVGVTYTR